MSVLRGQSLVPAQIEWEWLEYQQQFNGLLQQFSALLARNAKSEKKRIDALASSLESSGPPSRAPAFANHKSELRHRAAAMRGLGIPAAKTYEPSQDFRFPEPPESPPPPPESEP